MKIVVQRVTQASVTLKETGARRAIGPGLAALVGITHGDTAEDARFLANKLAGLRLFEDDAGKMNRSLVETGGAMLIVSQFSLYGSTDKGRRPSFADAAPPAIALPVYQAFVAVVGAHHIPIATGEFGAEMLVEIANDGPVTFILESRNAAA